MIITVLYTISIVSFTVSLVLFQRNKSIDIIPLSLFTIAVIADLIYNLQNLIQYYSIRVIQFYFIDYIALIMMTYTLIIFWRETDKNNFGCEINNTKMRFLIISYILFIISFILGLIPTIVMMK